jgi:hydrocephalus-inducing protein
MLKQSTLENFTIEPMEKILKPSESEEIKVRFLSQKELKLKTSTSNSDIMLNIVEGDLLDKFKSIPILVNVNAVFSKYSISPLRNINFGPMQFGEQQTRTFEIRNEGLFDFKYNICDSLDEEAKAKIKEERKAEFEARLAGEEEAAGGKDDKAKGKKEAPKAPAKGAKGGKDAAPDGTVCKVTQYDISPAVGSVTPGQSAIITVVFNAQGDQLYDNTLALDIANRDPNVMPDGIPFQLMAESSHPGINTKDVEQIFEEQTVIPSLDPSINTQTVINSSLFSVQE